MKYYRIWFLFLTVAWTIVGGGVLLDTQVKDGNFKLAIAITITTFWGVVASWKYIWKPL